MLDENGDNRLSFNELLGFVAKQSRIDIDKIPDAIKAGLKAEFEYWDADQDGYITEDDLITLYIAGSRRLGA